MNEITDPNVMESVPIKVPYAADLTRRAGLPTEPISVEGYASPEFFERERKMLFGRAWLNMGRIEQLPKPNTFFVKRLDVVKAELLITRDSAGKVRAFHNVCTHRGNLVALEACGAKARFTCRYHSWTYANDGSLIGAPDAEQFFNFDKKRQGLTPVACEVWEGWIFVNFQKEPEVTLAEFLGPFDREYAGIPYFNTHQHLRIEATFNANWKLMADAFGEAYHVGSLHPATLAPSLSSDKNKLGRLVGGRTLGAHRMCSTYGNMDYVTPENSKVERLANFKIEGEGNSVLSGDTSGQAEAMLKHLAVNPDRSDHWSVDLNWIFPNFYVDISSGGFWTHEFWPIAHNKTFWVAKIYMPTATSWRDRMAQEHYSARWCEVILEDVSNCERIQRGLESGAIDHVTLQDGEFMIRHSLLTVNKWVNAKTVKEALA